MKDPQENQFIVVSDLRLGHFVYVDLGWLSHPFPLNAFRISHQDQISTLRSLGLTRVRYSPSKSASFESSSDAPAQLDESTDHSASDNDTRSAILAKQRARLKACEKQFGDATRSFRLAAESASTSPALAAKESLAAVDSMVAHLLCEGETSIRLLSDQVGERAALHSVNVSILSLLLGKALGFTESDLRELGLGALLHDIGKSELPSRLRLHDARFNPSERQLYFEHVAYGLNIGKQMGLSTGALLVIAQHHELADGSGLPQRLKGVSMTPQGRVVSLVNRYDNLVNGAPGSAMTPHEALSHLFAQQKNKFDPAILGTFIRMMGIYPPGSFVQLTDQRYGLVVSVNTNRPLKPHVILHEPNVRCEEAMIVDLELESELGIRRSLKPEQLPKDVLSALGLRDRVCYFFENRLKDQPAAMGAVCSV